MTVREFNFPEVIYKEHLKEIQGIKFTTREIEIIAFILSGRSGKKTASFFSISPKTVENYTHNIKEKLRCNSREGIIDFIEKSGRFLIIKRYYLSLLIHADFEAALKKIAISNEKTSCSIVRWQFQEDGYGLLPYLKTHLKLAGFKVSYDNRRQHKSFHHLLDEPSQGIYRVYLLPALIRKEFQNPVSDLSHSNPPNKEFQRKLFIFPAKEEGTLSIEGGGNYSNSR
jgi:DNA-binding CsgD family transcriptional regulator